MIAVAGDTDRAIQCLISVVFHHAAAGSRLEHTMVHYLKN